VILMVALAAAVLGCARPVWVRAVWTGAGAGSSGTSAVTATGAEVAGTATASALVLAACALAITLAGRRTTVAVAGLAGLAGAANAGAAVRVLIWPADLLRGSLAEAAGVTVDSVAVQSVTATVTAWPVADAVLGALTVALVCWVGWSSRRWQRTARFDGPGGHAPTRDDGRGDAASTWDALTRGDDPTQREAQSPS
jgi:hypothetical protein